MVTEIQQACTVVRPFRKLILQYTYCRLMSGAGFEPRFYHCPRKYCIDWLQGQTEMFNQFLHI